MGHNQFRSRMGTKVLLGIAIAATIPGCASMKSPRNWFSSNTATDGYGTPETSFAGSLANTGKGIGGQIKSMGTVVTSAMGKAKNAVVSPFATKAVENEDETSLANMPTNLGPEIWITNGLLYESQGNHNRALDNYTKALEIEPNNLAALQSTARLYVKQQQYAPAIDFFNRAVAVSATAPNYAELANAQQQLGKIPEAQASIQKAIELEPTSTRYRNTMAGMLVAQGRSDEAIQQLEQVFPSAVANYNVAYLHFVNKNMAGAQQHLQAALTADPNLQPARDLLATISASQSAKSAVAAYGTADQISRTAQGIVNPTVQAQAAPFSNTPTFSPATMPQPGNASAQ